LSGVTRPPSPPSMQRIRHKTDIAKLVFRDGVAAVMVDGRLLSRIRFKNHKREDSPRLDAVARSIRRWGYQPRDPIVCRIGQKGRWIVLDGGHRLTAARRINKECWTNLFRRKVRDVYFLLYEGERSWAKSGRPEAAGAPPGPAGDAAVPDGVRDAPR